MTETEAWQAIKQNGATPDLLDELNAFGQMLLSEVTDRFNALDSKNQILLGIGGGYSVYLFNIATDANHAVWTASYGRALFAIATLATLACVTSVAAGLWARTSKGCWPSHRDWFDVRFLHDTISLRMTHLMSLKAGIDWLEARAVYSARALRIGQIAIAIATAALLVSPLLLVSRAAVAAAPKKVSAPRVGPASAHPAPGPTAAAPRFRGIS